MQKKEKEGRKKLKYDSNDGLLPEIRKFCGFPEYKVEELSPRGAGKKKKQIEEEWKWIEAQICGLCSTGGDILCCERCPASFHLACIGYESSDVPEGEFYCNRCKNMPEGVNLFNPEQCSTSANPLHRIENENRRNIETIKFQYERLKKEAEAEKANNEEAFGPLNDMEQMKNDFPDKNLLKALAMVNPMDFTLPPEYLLEREFYPNDVMEDRRPHINGEVCAECGLKNDWSPMLNCDFCDLVWHQKCVNPPLVNIPRLSYWMCPRHAETLLDSVWLGDEMTRDDRNKMHAEYEDVDVSLEMFEMFCEATEKLRLEKVILEQTVEDEFYYAPEENPNTSFVSPVLSPKKSGIRKGGRGKKKSEIRFFNDTYSLKGINENAFSTVGKSVRKESDAPSIERKDRILDRLDKKRSQLFTDEELIMSVMPYNESARSDYLTKQMLGTDFEMATAFLQRHTSMVARSKTFYSNFSEKELIKLMRGDLDPVETVRGGGAQSICNSQEKTYRKKIKADVELLIQLIGFGNDHADRKVNSVYSEAFFRRCAPPPSAQDVLNQRTLREIVLNSQKEAHEISSVYKYHQNLDKLENLVFFAYDKHFESAEERDSYFASSMTIWSKEPLPALTAKWAEEGRAMREKSETPAESITGISTEGSVVAEQKANESTDPGFNFPVRDRTESPIADLLITDGAISNEPPKSPTPIGSDIEVKEEDASPRTHRESSTPSILYSNGVESLEFLEDNMTSVIEKLALVNFNGLKMQDEYEKAETIHEAEGFYGESDEVIWEMRRIKSETQLIDKPIWSAAKNSLQTFVRRDNSYQIHREHNYSLLDPTYYSDKDESIEVQNPSMSVDQAENQEEDDKDSHYSIEFASPSTPPAASYENFVDPPTIRKRGRPIGSKNRKEGEAVPKRKRNSVGSTSSGRGRGRGGRPRGSRGKRGGGSVANSSDGGGSSRRQSRAFSSDALESPERGSSIISNKLREEVEEVRQKYAKMMIARSLEEAKDRYFKIRDEVLEKWTAEQQQSLKERCLAERLNSLILYEPRYFLPTQRVLARLDVDNQHLPIAIQRCLTKFGTSRDCHVRIDKLTKNYCHVLADYHCDIIREYHSDVFYLSTLATEVVIVNDIAVQRPQLTPLESAERIRAKVTSAAIPSNLKCQCQKNSDQIVSHQSNTGELIRCGVVKLEDGSRIQIGCVTLTFCKT